MFTQIEVDRQYDVNGNLLVIHSLVLEYVEVNGKNIATEQTKEILKMVGILKTDSSKRKQGGWDVTSKLPNETKTTSRWQRLVNHTNSKDGHHALKAILTPKTKKGK